MAGKKVLICMASSILGGPGKGLVQFFRCGGLQQCNPVMVAFDDSGRADSEFIARMKDVGVDLELIRQDSPFDMSMIKQMRTINSLHDFDVYQSHGYKSHVLCLLLKLMTGKPWVAFVHGWTTENFKMCIYRWLDMVLIRFADRVITVSENTVARLGPLIRHKVEVITNAVDPGEYDLGSDPLKVREQFSVSDDELLFCTVGRLSPEKGHSFLVDAVAQGRDRLENVRFIFVGDGQCRKDLESQVRAHGLENVVMFAGYSQEMASFYAACDGLILPSLSEGMPNVALEAMLFAKPVLATRVGGVQEVVIHNETGIMVESASAESLAEGLLELVSDRLRMRAMGERGAEVVAQRFNPYRRVAQIVAIYDKILKKQAD